MFSRVFGDDTKKIIEEERRLLYVVLTRAIKTLVVITDGQRKSPFLEGLEKRQPLTAVKWTYLPQDRDSMSSLIVKVGNQENRGSTATVAIKELQI